MVETTLITTLMASILSGGNTALLAILLLVIGYLAYDRREVYKELKSLRDIHEKNIMEVIDKYHEGQISLIEAFNELKTILAVIREKG